MLGRNGYRNRIELLQGTLDMLILRTQQWGPSHGYGIVQALRTHSGETLQVETGSLYPALHQLERQGWVESEWKQTESNQRARFYSITAAGGSSFTTILAGGRRWWMRSDRYFTARRREMRHELLAVRAA